MGDYVLIHVGFAMSKVDEKEAEETAAHAPGAWRISSEFEQLLPLTLSPRFLVCVFGLRSLILTVFFD